ncbi:GIY-YIG nuclease family protein [Agromyces larvae]|uniref:GIY-YIG nuclease family protein n=1 Tax=Agromyces larvae TaxID=2929802 RepID=A0ABY4C740_9MICO|nr:GIY-YIG nuclease family protein [Agromyces larvae]UOE44515.1 GIY-YIG nuclease family protein [Agromyces larvae]
MIWVYILRCSNGAYYVGSTRQPVEARVWQHNQGLGANFTRKHRPVELVYAEAWDRIDDAFAREKQLQGWSRAKKLALIEGRGDQLPSLARTSKRRLPEPVEGGPASTSSASYDRHSEPPTAP